MTDRSDRWRHTPLPRTRRRLLRDALAGAGALLVASALPVGAEAQELCPQCGLNFGPLHRMIWAQSPDPWFSDFVCYRESRYFPGAFNRSSGASGLFQFIPSTFAWGAERFGIYGSPFDAATAVAMHAAFLRVGEYYHWSETAPGGR